MRLLEGLAQRLDLGEVELPVAARGPARRRDSRSGAPTSAACWGLRRAWRKRRGFGGHSSCCRLARRDRPPGKEHATPFERQRRSVTGIQSLEHEQSGVRRSARPDSRAVTDAELLRAGARSPSADCPSRRGVHQQHKQVVRARRVRVRRNEELRDVPVDRRASPRSPAAARRAADTAHTDSAESITRNGSSARGATSAARLQHEPQPAVAADARAAGRGARRRRQAAVPAERDELAGRARRPAPGGRRAGASCLRLRVAARPVAAGARAPRRGAPRGGRRRARAAGAVRRTACRAGSRAPAALSTLDDWCVRRNSASGSWPGGGAHAVGPARDVVVGRRGRRRSRARRATATRRRPEAREACRPAAP